MNFMFRTFADEKESNESLKSLCSCFLQYQEDAYLKENKNREKISQFKM